MNSARFMPMGGVRACDGSKLGSAACRISVTREAFLWTVRTLRESCASLSSPDE